MSIRECYLGMNTDQGGCVAVRTLVGAAQRVLQVVVNAASVLRDAAHLTLHLPEALPLPCPVSLQEKK